MDSNNLCNILNASNIINRVDGCRFDYITNTLSRKINIPIYVQHNSGTKLVTRSFQFDTGAAVTCMSLNNIQQLFGYSYTDIDYSDLVFCSGFTGGMAYMLPILIPRVIVGGFILEDFRLYTKFDLRPRMKTEELIGDYKKHLRAARLMIDSKRVHIPMSRVDDLAQQLYRDAFKNIFDTCILYNGPSSIDTEKTLDNIKKRFIVDNSYTSELLGLDVLSCFDIIITQPRHKMELKTENIITKDNSTVSKTYYVNSKPTTEGKLYLSIPDELIAKSIRVSEYCKANYRIYRVEDLKSNPVIADFLDTNAGISYHSSSMEDVYKSLSQNNQIVYERPSDVTIDDSNNYTVTHTNQDIDTSNQYFDELNGYLDESNEYLDESDQCSDEPDEPYQYNNQQSPDELNQYISSEKPYNQLIFGQGILDKDTDSTEYNE